MGTNFSKEEKVINSTFSSFLSVILHMYITLVAKLTLIPVKMIIVYLPGHLHTDTQGMFA